MRPYRSRSRNVSGDRRLAPASSSKVRLTADGPGLSGSGVASRAEGRAGFGLAVGASPGVGPGAGTLIGAVEGWPLLGIGSAVSAVSPSAVVPAVSSDSRPLITLR